MLLVVISIGIYNIKSHIKRNKEIDRYISEFKEMKTKEILKYRLLGSELIISDFNNIEDDSSFNSIRHDTKYVAYIILPKVYCGQCLSHFSYKLGEMKQNKVSTYILGYDKNNMKNIKLMYSTTLPIYYNNSIKWFNDLSIISGPIAIIVDRVSGKVINTFDGLYILQNCDELFIEYLYKINN